MSRGELLGVLETSMVVETAGHRRKARECRGRRGRGRKVATGLRARAWGGEMQRSFDLVL